MFFPVTRRCRQKLNESNHVTLNKVFFHTEAFRAERVWELIQNGHKTILQNTSKLTCNIFVSCAHFFAGQKKAFNMTNTKNCSFKRILLQPIYIYIYIYTCCYSFLKYGKIRRVNNVQNIAFFAQVEILQRKLKSTWNIG